MSSSVFPSRLVQNAGEFVVTFPGAYHSGFSHGGFADQQCTFYFNTNIAFSLN